MKWTVTGKLQNADRAASVTWNNGEISGDEFAVEKLEMLAKNRTEIALIEVSPLGWYSPPGDHLKNSIGAWLLLRDEVFEDGTMTSEGDYHIPEELRTLDPNVVN